MRDFGPFVLYFLTCGVPLLLILILLATVILWPVFTAPKVAEIAREAGRRMDGDPYITRDQLKQYLREEYYPEWAKKGPDGNLPEHYDRGAAVQFFMDMRWSVAAGVYDRRIDKALDLIRDSEDGDGRRRRKRKKRR